MIQDTKQLEFIQTVMKSISSIPLDDYEFLSSKKKDDYYDKVRECVKNHTLEQPELNDRITAEYFSFGPLDKLMKSDDVTEIIVNGPNSIWYETRGKMTELPDCFYSLQTYKNILERICLAANTFATTEHPIVDSSFEKFRLCLVTQDITQSITQYSLRKHPTNPWNFEKLFENGWAPEQQVNLIKSIVKNQESFLIVGGTGCGKTSVINACLQELSNNERALIIEDTNELHVPNNLSSKLLTRRDSQNILPEINQSDLVKAALRLRPDRIIMGEIRSDEAKDFLMALSTGHNGSFGTIHADNAPQALLRLEMLIQMAAPQWSLMAIRRLIQMSLKNIITLEKDSNGNRRLKALHKIESLEESGFLLDCSWENSKNIHNIS